MLRPAIRLSLRTAPTRANLRGVAFRRHLSTAPPSQKSRSWKSSALRWGLAGVGVYYYNTSNVFAEEPEHSLAALSSREEPDQFPTLEEVAEQRRRSKSLYESSTASSPVQNEVQSEVKTVVDGEEVAPGSPQELEQEADQQGAFNPETGEINWDCPCLGGMANGPCGEAFKEAFSCFVYSKEEPKGVDCIDRFKNMQDCFRQHPDVYGAELADDDEDDDLDALDEPQVPAHASGTNSSSAQSSHASNTTSFSSSPSQSENMQQRSSQKSSTIANIPPQETQKASKKTEQFPQAKNPSQSEQPPASLDGELVPKAWHDGRADQSSPE